MLDLLSGVFCTHYGIVKRIDVDIIPKIITSEHQFAIWDDSSIISNEEKNHVLAIDNHIENNNITILSYESFHNQIGINFEEKCDYLLFDSAKRAFICAELSRLLSTYLETHPQEGKPVEGKRAKAYRQLEITTNKLLAVYQISEFISSFLKHIAVFAYRLNDSNLIFARSVNAFNRSPKSLDTNFGNGFYFYQREYPALLVI
jgi:hypothetical protein